MAPRSETSKRQKKDAGVEEDRLSALHEDILLHILSFLPSRELVQKTCLLARSWRNRWKSVPALRVPEDVVFESAHAVNKFVNYLVFLRGPKPLVECEINFWHMDETFDYLDLWIRYALSCKVQVLRIISDVEYDLCPLPDMPLVSDKSTTVELCRVEPREPLLDFSGCSALQDLTMSYSTVENILSPSVKRLSICYCTFSRDFRARISAPSLVFLELVSYSGMTPFLDNMPSLVSASIRHGDLHHEDRCKSRFEIGGCADVSCQGCVHSKGDGNKSVLLASLSHALHLKLTSDEGMFIFRRYLTLRPVFSKLKTLVLDDWCMVANLHALIFFLQHSPLLEKLTLKLSTDHEDTVAKEAKYEWTEQAFAFKHLTVEVKCYEFSERIKKNLEVLVSCGVPPGQIKILRYRKISRR